MIQFNAATKKNGYYLASPKQTISYNLTNIDFVNISALKNNKFLMSVKISQSKDNEILSSMERTVQSTVIENNMVWFNNSLNKEESKEALSHLIIWNPTLGRKMASVQGGGFTRRKSMVEMV